MEQRNHRQHRIAGSRPQRIPGVGHQRVQHVGTMRVQDALGIAGRTRGVAHRSRGIFVKRLPGKVAVGLRDPVFIGYRVLQRGLRHVRLVGKHDVAFHAWKLAGDLLQHRHEGEIRHHQPVFRVVDDPGDLVGEQPRIDGVADRADPHDAVPDFEVTPCVPGDGGNAVAELDAAAIEALRDLQGTVPDFGVICAVNGTLHRPRHDLLRSMNGRGVLDNPVTEQRPVLHQTTHTNIPPDNNDACRGVLE